MLKKKTSLWIGGTALVTAVATAVPIAVIYGTENKSELETVDLTSSANPLVLAWGKEPKELTAPPLPPGRNAQSYSPGTLYETNYDPKRAIIGQEDFQATFEYLPVVNANVEKLHVKYRLMLAKAYTPALLLTEYQDVIYSEPRPVFDFQKWLLDNNYAGYYAGAYQQPVYTDSQGKVVEEEQLVRAPAGSSYVATYKARLDTEHYLDNKQRTGIYKIIYTVKPKALELVQDLKRSEERVLRYGDSFALPAAPGPQEHYVLKSTFPELLVESRPPSAVFTPAEGQSATAGEIKKYEAGTVFKAVYTYRPADDYTGEDYTFTYRFTIEPQSAQKAVKETLEPKPVEYGKFPAYTYPPPPFGGIGYVGSYVSTKVTKQSPLPGQFSPIKNAEVDWALINQYNAGTEFEIVYRYDITPNYEGKPFNVTQRYTITRQRVVVPNAMTAAEQTITFGADFASVATPDFADKAKYEQTALAYYAGNSPADRKLNAEQIKVLAAGSTFYARYTFSLKQDNYAPADGKVSAFDYVVPVRIVKATASYRGSRTYAAQTVPYGSPAPSDFVPSSLPEPNLATGYVFSSASYQVTRAAVDGSIGIGQLPDLSKLSSYGAQTTILATFKFVPDANHAGPDVTVTRTLTIVPAQGRQPTAAEMTIAPFHRTYGQTQETPTAPKSFIGFKNGAYVRAEITKAADQGEPSTLGIAADWSRFSTYGAGTIVTVTFHYEPNGNYSGLSAFDLTVNYVIDKKPANMPAGVSFATVNYEYGIEQKAPVAPAIAGAEGYVGAITSVKITRGTGNVGKDVAWDQTDTYPAGTEFEVTYTYLPAANYSGTSVVLTQKYVVMRRKVKIPADVQLTTVVRYDRGTDPLGLNPPSIANSTLYAVRGSPVFFDANKNTLTAAQVKVLAEKQTFFSVWTIGLKDTSNYAPETGATDTYKITVPHQVYLSDVSYSGARTYPVVELVYGSKPANFVPSTPPEASTVGYVFKSIAYNVTAAPADKSVALGPIPDLSKVDTYGAGTVITATVTFKPDANHTGADLQFTKVLKIVPAAGTQPTETQRTFAPVDRTYGSAQSLPAAPASFKGFKPGRYERSTVITPALTGMPSLQTSVDWARFHTYGAGTVIEVVYTYEPDGNYSGLTTFQTRVQYRITPANPVRPAFTVLPVQSLDYKTKLVKPTAPANQGTGYAGSFLSAKLDKDIPGGAKAGTEVDWNLVDTYPAGTAFTVTFTYQNTPNYKQDSFTMTQKYVIAKRKVTIPRPVSAQATVAYFKNTDPAALEAPNPADASLYQLSGSPAYLDEAGKPLTVSQIRQLGKGAKFVKRWTFVLKDTGNYEPSDGMTNTYTHSLTYSVALAPAFYTGVKTYPPANAAYLQKAPADFVPNVLPEPAKGKGYVFKGVKYAVTTAPADGSAPAGPLADLSKVSTYGAGTVITAAITFGPDADHDGLDLTLTRTLNIAPAAGIQPTTAQQTFPEVVVTYGSALSEPQPPRTYTGFKPGAYIKAEVTTAGPSNYPAKNAVVDWAKFSTYGAGTVITVTYRYEPDGNYSGLTAFNVSVAYRIKKKPAVRPSQTSLTPVTYEYGTTKVAPTAPALAEGYGGVLTSAKISKAVPGSPALQTTVDWAKTGTYPAGTEFTLLFTYSALPNYEGKDFSVQQKYEVTKQKVAIPADTVAAGELTYPKASSVATISAFAPQDQRFVVRGAPRYFNEKGLPIDASSIPSLEAGMKFSVQWTIGLKDAANFAPAQGTKDQYKMTVRYVVILTPAYYTGKKSYDPQTVVYGKGLPPPVFAALPEPQKGSGYVFKSISYAVTTAPADGSVKAQPISDLSKVSTYGAGTVITATVVFGHDSAHSGDDITLTQTITVTKAAGLQPSAAQTAPVVISKIYGDQQAKPVAPKNFAHFQPGAYVSAAVTVPATDGSTKTSTVVDWDKFATYGAGTEVTVTFRYEPSPNYSGLKPFDLQVKYVIKKAAATKPATFTLPARQYQYGTSQAKPQPPGGIGVGYVGSFENAVITKTVAGGPGANTDVVWNATNTYLSGTRFTVTFKYRADPNHEGAEFTVTQDYVVAKRKVAVPADRTNLAGAVYFIRSDPAALKSPTITDPLFAVIGSPSYFDAQGNQLSAEQVRQLAKEKTFTVKWTVGLRDPANYEPEQASRSTYTVTDSYVVTLLPAKYESAKLAYDSVSSVYGQPIANFAPTELPDPGKSQGYVFDSIVYRITTAPADGSVGLGDIPDLSRANTYGAGTDITAYVTFKNAADYSGAPITVTKVWSIKQAVGKQPSGSALSIPPFERKYQDTQGKPVAAPKQFTGFKEGAYVSAAITTPAPDRSNTLNDPVDWLLFPTYGAGTVITVVYHYVPDGNYSGLREFDLFVRYVIDPKDAVQPQNKSFAEVEVQYDEQVNKPTAPTGQGEGYVGTEVSARIIKSVSTLYKVGAPVDWSLTRVYPAGTEFEVTFKYEAATNYVGDPFTMTRKYVVSKRRVSIPKDQTDRAESVYYIKSNPALLANPTITDPLFEIRNGAAYLDEQGAPLTAQQIRGLKKGQKFSIQWTIGLKDPANYGPKTGDRDYYLITRKYVVTLLVASYSGKKTYDPVTISHKQTAPADFVPTELPEATGVGYVFDRVTYAITTPPYDKKLTVGPIDGLAGVAGYGAGTVITATITFVSAPDYDGAPLTITKTLTIAKAPGRQPTGSAIEPVNISTTFGDSMNKPVKGPRTFEGFMDGEYVSALITTQAADDSNQVNVAPDWTKFATYGAGTVIKVVYRYEPDVNYSGLHAFDLEVYYTIGYKTPNPRTDYNLEPGEYAYGTKLARPQPPTDEFAGEGYEYSETEAFISKPAPGGDPVGTRVDWNRTDTYGVGTEITVRFIYKLKPNYKSNTMTITFEKRYTVVSR